MENIDIKPELVKIKQEVDDGINEEPNGNSYNVEDVDIKPTVDPNLLKAAEEKEDEAQQQQQLQQESFLSNIGLSSRNGSNLIQQTETQPPSKCKLCLEPFPNSKLLEEHEKSCKFGIKQEPDLDINEESNANVERTEYKCEFCPKIFYSNVSIRDHMALHVRPDAFKCKICPSKFTHLRSLQYHMRNHARTDKFKCTDCGKEFYHLCNLKEHMAIHSEILVKELTCDVCKKVFSTKKNLKNHVNSGRCKPQEVAAETSDLTIYKCKFCEEKFDSTASIKDHLLKHASKKKSHTCNLCEEKFDELEKLKEHEDMHRANRPEMSDLAEFKDLLVQMRKQKAEVFECRFCSKVFSSYRSIADHVELHQDPTAFKCEICLASFTLNRTLLLHMKSHQELQNFPCTLCGRTFIREKSLKQHLDLHAKPQLVEMTCKFCDKLLKSKENMEKHIVTCLLNPNRQKLYSCGQCGIFVNTEYDLQMHVLEHGPADTTGTHFMSFTSQPEAEQPMETDMDSEPAGDWSQYIDTPSESTSGMTVIDEPLSNVTVKMEEDTNAPLNVNVKVEDFIGADDDDDMQMIDGQECTTYSQHGAAMYYEKPKVKQEAVDDASSMNTTTEAVEKETTGFGMEPMVQRPMTETAGFGMEPTETVRFGMESVTQRPITETVANSVTKEANKEELKCIYCHKVFKKKATLGSHVFLCRKIVDDRKDNACSLCNKAFMNIKLVSWNSREFLVT